MFRDLQAMSIVPTRIRGGMTDYQRFSRRFPEFVTEMIEERGRYDAKLSRLQLVSGRPRHNLVRKLLADRRLHRIFAFDAVKRTGGLWVGTPSDIETLAEQFDAFNSFHTEPVRLRTVSKGSGRRDVQEFGPRRRMQQALVARLLRHLHPPRASQKLFNGGMPMARKAIEDAVRSGNLFGVEVDFVGFYGSLCSEALPQLLRPLPTSVVDAVVWDDAARAPTRSRDAVRLEPPSSSYEGLSLGSACSPIVGEIVISALLAAAQLEDVVTFADNLFVFGRTEEDVSAKIQALRNVMRNHAFGELELRVSRDRGFNLSFDFEFAKQAGVLRDGRIYWAPGSQKITQFMSSDAQFLTFPEISKIERRVVHWRRAYPDWDGGDAFEAEYLAALAVRRFYLARHPMHLSGAISAVLRAYYERCVIEASFPGGLHFFIPQEGDPLGDGYLRLTTALERFVRQNQEAA